MIGRVWPVLSLAVLAVATATVGTGVHRASEPWGVTGAIAMIACAAIFARAWKNWLGLGVYGALWVAVVTAFSMQSDSGSILILADTVGYAWLIGGAVAVVVASVLPKSALRGPADVAPAT